MRPAQELLQGRKAALFDLDGTLIDSIGLWNEADRRLARELTGHAPEEAAVQALRDGALRRFRGEPDPYMRYCELLRRRYDTAVSAEQLYARRSAIARELQRDMDYKPGADRFLWALKRAGFSLALTTTGRRSSLENYCANARRMVEKAPPEALFDRIFTCEDVSRIKPDPEIYLLALAALDLPAERCVVFEDSLAGVQAAKAAGLDTVAVYDRYSDDDRAAIQALADGCIGGFEELA